MSTSGVAVPARYRHPIDDPDPALAAPYRALFSRRIRPPEPGQVERLAAGLMQSDPRADAWWMRARALGREPAGHMFEQASRHGVASVPDAPRELVELFAQTERVPSWVDPDKLERGGIAFRRSGPLGHFVLSDFGLMGGYRSAAVAKTLMSTGKLAHGATERLIHTGHFVVAATEPGQILPGRPGYAHTLRVRVVHAMVRAGLLARGFDVAQWGIPINQSDTLGTNLLFSIGFIEGCKQWGLRFTDREVDAIIHLWRYIGYLIGIDEDLLPTDEHSAQRALYLVGVSQPEPDADSRALAKALHDVPFTFERGPLAKKIIEREVDLRLAMTRRILGDQAVDELGLPPSSLAHVLPRVIRAISAFERVRELVPGASHAAYRVSDFLVKKGQELLDAELAAQKTPRLQGALLSA